MPGCLADDDDGDVGWDVCVAGSSMDLLPTSTGNLSLNDFANAVGQEVYLMAAEELVAMKQMIVKIDR